MGGGGGNIMKIDNFYIFLSLYYLMNKEIEREKLSKIRERKGKFRNTERKEGKRGDRKGDGE